LRRRIEEWEEPGESMADKIRELLA
jgi:hypothetical protein